MFALHLHTTKLSSSGPKIIYCSLPQGANVLAFSLQIGFLRGPSSFGSFAASCDRSVRSEQRIFLELRHCHFIADCVCGTVDFLLGQRANRNRRSMAGRANIPMAFSIQSGLDGHFAVRMTVGSCEHPSTYKIFRTSFFSGVPYIIIVINIPQRFQGLYGTSPFEAGVRLIPFNFLIAFGIVVANISAAKTRIPPIYLLFIGSTIQLIGLALFSTLSSDPHIPPVIYGWEVLSGFGIGIVFGILLLIPPQVVEQRDLGMDVPGHSLHNFT